MFDEVQKHYKDFMLHETPEYFASIIFEYPWLMSHDSSCNDLYLDMNEKFPRRESKNVGSTEQDYNDAYRAHDTSKEVVKSYYTKHKKRWQQCVLTTNFELLFKAIKAHLEYLVVILLPILAYIALLSLFKIIPLAAPILIHIFSKIFQLAGKFLRWLVEGFKND